MYTERMVSPDRFRIAPLSTSRSSAVIFPSAVIIRYIASQMGPYSLTAAQQLGRLRGETLASPLSAMEGRWPRARS